MMDINKMKDTFLSRSREPAENMLSYFWDVMGIKDSGIWNCIGYSIVSVDPEEYERVLREGRKYACAEDMGIFWMNCYDDRRSPIASVDIGLGYLQKSMNLSKTEI